MMDRPGNTYEVAITTGGSMYPLIHNGDVVIIQSTPKYKRGDIILYKIDNIPTCHRILSNGEFIKTKGDNNPWVDEYNIKKEDVIGKVIRVIKKKNNKVIIINQTHNYLMIGYNHFELSMVHFFNIFNRRGLRSYKTKQLIRTIYWLINRKYFHYEVSRTI
jgi:signal peptidase I